MYSFKVNNTILMKGIKMKNDEKLKYIYNHIQTLIEHLETIKENLKWMSGDVKVIEKLSKSK